MGKLIVALLVLSVALSVVSLVSLETEFPRSKPFIPKATTLAIDTTLSADPKTSVYTPLYNGSGEIFWVMFNVDSALERDYLWCLIEVDGNQILYLTTFSGWYKYYLDQGLPTGIIIAKYDTTTNHYTLIVNMRIPFKENFRLGYFNVHTSEPLFGNIVALASIQEEIK
jgi:hypothetical protein